MCVFTPVCVCVCVCVKGTSQIKKQMGHSCYAEHFHVSMIFTLTKIINATLLFLPPFFMS